MTARDLNPPLGPRMRMACRLTTTACAGPRNQTPLLTWGVHTSPFAFATPQATRHSMHSSSQLSAIARMHRLVWPAYRHSPRTTTLRSRTHFVALTNQLSVFYPQLAFYHNTLSGNRRAKFDGKVVYNSGWMFKLVGESKVLAAWSCTHLPRVGKAFAMCTCE
jgi:hypothetical protein